MALSTELQQVLQIMRQDAATAGFPFLASDFWKAEAERFQLFFEKFGINDVEGEYYNTRFHGIEQEDPKLFGWFITCFYWLLKQRDSLGLLDRFESTLRSESSFIQYQTGGKTIKTGYAVTVADRTVSADLLFTVYDIYNLLELNPALATAPLVLGDLGAGWGRIGYVLLRLNPRLTYVIFDIPEVLIISSAYLPKLLPDLSVCHYVEARKLAKFDRETLKRRSIWFLGSHHLGHCAPGTLDMVLNVASFQEMQPRQVNEYLKLFSEEASSGHVYLRNNKLDPNCSFSQYRIPEPWKPVFLRDSRFSADVFEAGFRIP